MSRNLNALAQRLAELHRPGHPVLLTNVWDVPTAKIALRNPATKALATASYAVAEVNGLEDDDLTLEANLEACRKIGEELKKSGKAEQIPFSVDLQEGYGDRLVEAIEVGFRAVRFGARIEAGQRP